MDTKNPKLVALALAGVLTLAAFAGCVGGGGNAPSPAPTNTAIVSEAPDPRPTVSPFVPLTSTANPTAIDMDTLLEVVAPPTATAAPTPTLPWPTPTPFTRPVMPTRIALPPIPTWTSTFVTPTPWPTIAPRPTVVIAITPIPVPTRIPVVPPTLVPPTRISLLPTPTSTPTPSPSPTPTAQALTVAEYLAWCANNTSNDTTARVLGIDPTDFADVSTVTNGDMVRALEAHVEVVDSVEPPSAIERFHTAQRNWFEGLSGFYGGYPANEYVDWGSFEQNLLADTDLSWQLLTLTTALERLPDHIRNPITSNCLN